MMGLDAMHLLFAHLSVAFLYVLCGLQERNRVQLAAETVFVLALPVVGLLSMLGYRIACRIFHMEEVQVQKEAKEKDSLPMGGMKHDGNVVPFHDSFLLEDAGKKRELFTTAIKQEVVTNQAILRMAMSDNDREIAYYAVSLLTTKMEKLENKLFVEEGRLQKRQEAEHIEDLEEYAATLREYLSHEKFIDHVTFRQKRNMYLGVLDRLVSLLPYRKEYYMAELHQLISEKNYRAASDVCRIFQEHFSQDEDAYLMYIRLYHAERDTGKMQEKIAELKASPIKLSPEALRIVRYWDQEADHG